MKVRKFINFSVDFFLIKCETQDSCKILNFYSIFYFIFHWLIIKWTTSFYCRWIYKHISTSWSLSLLNFSLSLCLSFSLSLFISLSLSVCPSLSLCLPVTLYYSLSLSQMWSQAEVEVTPALAKKGKGKVTYLILFFFLFFFLFLLLFLYISYYLSSQLLTMSRPITSSFFIHLIFHVYCCFLPLSFLLFR